MDEEPYDDGDPVTSTDSESKNEYNRKVRGTYQGKIFRQSQPQTPNRQREELSDIAIIESLRAIGFNESEILDPIVTAEPPRPYRTYTPKLAGQNFVVIPIYHPVVRHWTVGIAADGIIHHYNSHGDGTLDPETEQRIKDHLTAGKISLPKSTWTFIPAKSAQQVNEKDCGMFTVVNAIYHVCGMHDQIDEDIWPRIIRKGLGLHPESVHTQCCIDQELGPAQEFS
ncbi:hypothetical protein VE03_10459 [Pseudogymnoascus sp. 23342-1-I1]|nr:hypothetical protein VE03_10459 [Pseudogymnoascus sp. 23342-1-I1]